MCIRDSSAIFIRLFAAGPAHTVRPLSRRDRPTRCTLKQLGACSGGVNHAPSGIKLMPRRGLAQAHVRSVLPARRIRGRIVYERVQVLRKHTHLIAQCQALFRAVRRVDLAQLAMQRVGQQLVQRYAQLLSLIHIYWPTIRVRRSIRRCTRPRWPIV